MSNINSLPPSWPSAVFNSSLFNNTDYLTKDQADQLYLSIRASSILAYLDPANPGIVSANKAVIADSNRNLINFHNIESTDSDGHILYSGQNSHLTLSGTGAHIILNNNTEAGNSSGSQGALKISSGGAFFGNGVYINSGSNQSLTTTGPVSLLSNLTINSSVQVTNANTPSSGEGLEFNYSIGSSTANIYSYNRSTSQYKKLNLNDLITIDKPNNLVTSRANFDLGSTLYLNDSIASGLINVTNSNKRMYIQSPQNTDYSVLTFNRYGLYLNSSTSNPFSECNANCLLDFGNQAKPCSINLYGGTYSISANNNATQICSGGTNGVTFYTGNNYDIGTFLAQITNSGSVISGGGLRVTGPSSSGYSGSGLELEFAGGTANIFAYNRSTLLYKPMTINGTINLDGLGHCAIGTSVSGSWICEMGYNTQSVTGYGYLSSTGATGSSGGSTGSVNFSLRTNGRIACGGEIDVFSDRRVKSEIENISNEECELFIKNIEPKRYIFRPGNLDKLEYGYIAQDIAKIAQRNNSKLDLLITPVDEYHLKETIDEDGFISPENKLLTINYIKIIPLLHKYILIQEKKIEYQQKEIIVLQDHVKFLLSENKENNERLDELTDSVNELIK